MEYVEAHTHNDQDSPKIKVGDVDGGLTSDDVVTLTGDQTIAGTKTFSTRPELPASDPTTDNQACRKAYFDGLVEVVASDNLIDNAQTTRNPDTTDYAKYKEIEYNEIGGTIRVKFIMYTSFGATGYARIYKNGVAYGTERSTVTGSPGETFSEDLVFAKGDLIQLYAKKVTTTIAVEAFNLYYDKILTVVPGTVNTN